MIEVICACGRKLSAPDEAAGKRARCPKCGATLLIAAAKAAMPTAQNPPSPKPRPPVDLAQSTKPTILPPVDLAKSTKSTIRPLDDLESAVAAAQPSAAVAGKNKSALPTAGVTFHCSAAKTTGLLLADAGLFLLGLYCIWFGATSSRETVLFGGIACVFGSPVMAYYLIRSLLVKRRVVVSADRLQEVEHLGGQDVVVLQIPFANIANMQYEVTSTERRFGINLRRLNDPATFARSVNFERCGEMLGWHHVLPAGFQGGPRAMGAEIERAYAQWSNR